MEYVIRVAERSPGLSAGVARLWQADTAVPPREALSPARIVAAAVALADGEGIAAVSMARVAERLGAGTMSLYRHVAGKDELLLLMHDTVWRASHDPTPVDLTRGWRPALEDWCRRQHDTLVAHPWLESIRFLERAGTPSQLEVLERGLEILDGVALPEAAKVSVLMLLNGYLLWTARYDEELRTAAATLGMAADEVTGQFGALMSALTADERFPAMARALAGGAFTPGTSTVGDYEVGLAVLLDGVEARLARR